MTAARFPTMFDLFDDYPSLKLHVKITPGDEEPIEFIRRHAKQGRLREAAALCAFLLSRRQTVWWACQCLRSRPGLADPDDPALLAAEQWVRDPSDETRDVAAQWGAEGEQTTPVTWAALSAGYSAGSVGTGVNGPIRAPRHLTAESARMAVLLAETRLEQKDVPAFLQGCVDSALAIVEGTAPSGR